MDDQSFAITRIMQAAIAPVTLISGIGFLILTMANRYGRALDRGRVVLKELEAVSPGSAVERMMELQLRMLFKRARLLRTTMATAATAIFFVTLTVGILFAQFSLDLPFEHAAQVTFILGLILLITSVMLFVSEVSTALSVFKLEIRTGEIARHKQEKAGCSQDHKLTLQN